jgi:hypothetical protein
MNVNVEIQEEWFSVAQCRKNPNKLYVFGDNLARVGIGGQACIRKEPNTFGIATKRLPSMSWDAFFSEKKDEIAAVYQDIDRLQQVLECGKYDTVVFPKDGLGTGLSRMPLKSPKLYKELNERLSKVFNIRYFID